ncbi:MAG: hypothetical protein J6Z31_10845 [Fibrobacter sp.]|nr:hypothetical protein [Fibrobacter sp.]
MNFRRFISILTLIFILTIVGCSDGSPSDIGSNTNTPDIQVKTLEDLPNCSKNREGEIAEVTEEKKAYICLDGRWEFDHVILDSAKTEDDLSACLSKNEGDSVWVEEESAIYVCTDRKWEKQKANDNDNLTNDSIPTYESENDLPNCTEKRNGNIALVNDSVQLCNDSKWQNLGSAYATSDSVPNCTQKREGETAFILDEYTALICTDGKWNEDEEVEDIVEKPVVNSSSSKANDNANSSSSSKNDSKESSSSKTQDEEKFSSGSSKEPTTGTVTDERDEKTYKTVKIGDRMWFCRKLKL